MTTASKYIDGVPQFAHRNSILGTCSTCIPVEQTNNAAIGTTLKATRPFQVLQWISVLLVFIPRISTVVETTLVFTERTTSCSSLITSPNIFGVELSGLKLFPYNISVIGLHQTVLLATILGMVASIQVDKCIVLLKLESSLNDPPSLSILLVLIVVINLVLLNASTVLLLTVFVLNLLEPILTIRFWPYYFNKTLHLLNANSCTGMDFSCLKLLLAVVITSRI